MNHKNIKLYPTESIRELKQKSTMDKRKKVIALKNSAANAASKSAAGKQSNDVKASADDAAIRRTADKKVKSVKASAKVAKQPKN